MRVSYDTETKNWMDHHIGHQTTVTQCDKCGLYYKTSLGHKCRKDYIKDEKRI